MAEPIRWKSKIVLVKTEGAAYGVNAGPTGAANFMLLTDVGLQPMEGQDVSRNLELPYLGAQEELPAGVYAVLTGTFELVGSGAPGVAPAWGPLLRACGVAEVIAAGTSVEYSPITDGQESVTASFQLAAGLHVLLGGRATATLSLNAQGIPVARVTITGLFVRPSDQARPAVDASAWQPPQVASKANTPTFTIGGASFVLRSYELNLGNDVQPRLLVGTERIVIVDRAESLTVTVEAVPYAIYNPFALALDGTRQAVILEHGTIIGRKVRVAIPTARQKRPTGIQQNQNIAEWPLGFSVLPTSAGNDQWKITLT